MNNKLSIKYFDRKTSSYKIENIFASQFLYWSYNNKLGRLLTKYIISRRIVSKLYGWFAQTSLSKRLIVFIINNNTDTNEHKTLSSYNSLNSYFTRKLNQSERSIDTSYHSCISPSDGKILAIENIKANKTFQIKRNLFDLNTFLQDNTLVNEFTDGTMVIIRLALSDYHHFSFPVSGFVYKTTNLNGKLYAGGSYSLHNLTPYYIENLRDITLINSDHYGLVAQVEIGAFTVGSIHQTYKPESRIKKGDPKGNFALGGSTIVLLFKKNKLQLDSDIISNSQKSIETKIKLGESFGCFKKNTSLQSKVDIS